MASGIGAVVSAAAAWGVTGGSAGLAAPAAVLPAPEAEPLRTVTLEEANDYLSLVQAACGRIAAGVGLCILCPIALLLLGAWADGTPREGFAAGAGMITLLVLVALGLLLILPAAMQLESYDYLEPGAWWAVCCRWCR